MLELYPHQKEALKLTQGKNKVAYWLDMGLGKTIVATEKMLELNSQALVVCPKTLIEKTWIPHFKKFYPTLTVENLARPKRVKTPYNLKADVLIINYESVWRKEEVKKLKIDTLILDESQNIKSPKSKQTKFILKLKYKNLILLSGTPCGGKYEELITQIKMLGWKVKEKDYWDTYINYFNMNVGTGFPIRKVTGYKNVERLKRKLSEHGAVFMATEDVFELPEQTDITMECEAPKEYAIFKKDRIVTIDNKEYVGDMPLNRLLYSRYLSSLHSVDKINTLKDLIESTEDRLIIFYNFKEELKILKEICKKYNKAISIVNGDLSDLEAYETKDNAISLIQYQSGSAGLNLQKCNKTIYFSPPLSVEMYMQSRKRTNRIGQLRPCFYYLLTCGIEKEIYETLHGGIDYTLKLFESRDK